MRRDNIRIFRLPGATQEELDAFRGQLDQQHWDPDYLIVTHCDVLLTEVPAAEFIIYSVPNANPEEFRAFHEQVVMAHQDPDFEVVCNLDGVSWTDLPERALLRVPEASAEQAAQVRADIEHALDMEAEFVVVPFYVICRAMTPPAPVSRQVRRFQKALKS